MKGVLPLTLGLALVALGAPLSADVTASATSAQLGEPFEVTVTFEHPANERYELAPREDFGAFELLEQRRERTDGETGSTTTFTLRFALFELDARPLGPLAFDVTSPSGTEQRTVEGPTITGVGSLDPNAASEGADPKDLKPPVDVPVRSWRLVWLISGALLGLVLLALLARYLWQLRRRLEKPAPLLPLTERTRQALRALQSEQLPQHGRSREFYFRLSEILRGHLGERYDFEALECTSEELLERVARLPAPELPRERLRDFVQESDLVKFAKMEVDPGACESALNFGFELVTRTVEAPSPQPPETEHVPESRVS